MSWSFTRLAPLLLLSASCGGTFEARGDDPGAGGAGPASGGAGGGSSSGGASAGGGTVGVSGGATGKGGSIVGAGGSAGSTGGAASGGQSGSGGAVTRVPVKHRPTALACGARPTPPPGAGGSGPGEPLPPQQACTTASECTAGPNGRCIGGRGGPYCAYDGCFGDGDCLTGAVCLCGTPDGAVNRCLGEGCRIDSDCPGSWCSPTFSSCGLYSGVTSYACHTAQDECVDDADCGGTPTGSGAYCMYSPMVSHWICSTSQCVG